MMTSLPRRTRPRHRRFAFRTGVSAGLIVLLCVAVTTAQDSLTADDTAAAGPEPIRASLNYSDVSPKQLTSILTEIYHVGFEGADTVTENLTLISKGQEMVDLPGMVSLLNKALAEQNKTARLDGQIIKIEPLLDFEELWIDLKYIPADDAVVFISDLYLAKPDDKPEVAASKAGKIMAHPSLPKILVRGPKAVTEKIRDMIVNELDRPSSAAPVNATKSYIPLEYIDAEEFNSILKTDESLAGTFTSMVAPQNIVMVACDSPETLARIQTLKETFDIDRMEIRYIPLSNANAKDVAALLQKIYPKAAEAAKDTADQDARQIGRRRRSRMQDQLGSSEHMKQLAQVMDEAGIDDPDIQALLSRSLSIVAVDELTIVPDTERNGLLVRTFSRNLPKIVELIEELDRPLRQVLIDAFITQVTLDDTTDIGVDLQYTGNTSWHNGAYTLMQGTLPAALSNPATASGLSYQLVSDNLQVFIRALQQTGRLDVVSRPQLIAKDNTEGRIALGKDVPTLSTTTVSSEGSISSTVKYEKVMTDLKVTPHIHPDGYVSMTIDQTIDDVGTETFEISEDFNPQVILRRIAKTQLRIKDGQTVCLGGFISDSIIDTEKKVPILGDIPLVGQLFKYTSRGRIKNELIIFITPHILETPMEMLRMTNEKRQASDSQFRKNDQNNELELQEHLAGPRYAEPIDEPTDSLASPPAEPATPDTPDPVPAPEEGVTAPE